MHAATSFAGNSVCSFIQRSSTARAFASATRRGRKVHFASSALLTFANVSLRLSTTFCAMCCAAIHSMLAALSTGRRRLPATCFAANGDNYTLHIGNCVKKSRNIAEDANEPRATMSAVGATATYARSQRYHAKEFTSSVIASSCRQRNENIFLCRSFFTTSASSSLASA